jgi:hypothetical protein
MSEELLTDPDPTVLRHVASHELYHDVQLTIGAFFDEHSFWYWEATAEWASQEMYPDDDGPFVFIGAYALVPELPLSYFGDPFGADPVTGVHQYGASLFPRYVTDRFTDRSLVPRSWETAGETADPLRVLDGLVEQASLGDLFADFSARNAAWDYEQRAQILSSLARYEAAFPERDRAAAMVGAGGTSGFVTVAPHRLPRALGYNLIEIEPPASGRVTVAVRADAAGSQGTPARTTATFVAGEGTDAEYTALDVSGAEATVDVGPGGSRGYLVVAAAVDERGELETFGYEFQVRPAASEPDPDPDPDPDADDPDDPGAGCCSSADRGAPLGSGVVLLLAIAVASRRRRR